MTVNVRYAGGGRFGDWGDECLVNGGDGERFLYKLDPNFFENTNRRSCNDGSRERNSRISQPSPKRPVLS